MAQLLRREVEGPGGLRLLRPRGLHPRPGQPEQPRGDLRHVYHEHAPRPRTRKTSGRSPRPRCPRARCTCPVFYDTLKTLDQTVPVDYYLPGCPPEAERIWEAIAAILEGKLPPPGSVIGANTTVCDECPRTRNEKKIKKFYRTWEIIPDEETCLLEQGLLCCGIATRAGCGALCPQVNSPCIGCYGPNDGVHDFGARLMTALASVIDSQRSGRDRPDHPRRASPTRSARFYRFSLAAQPAAAKQRRLGNGNGSRTVQCTSSPPRDTA